MENKINPLDSADFKENRGVLYQVSLLQGLTNGDYDGSTEIAEIKRHGDTGIGTFHKLNGELIMLDGIAYRAAGNGKVEIVSDRETSPFCAVSFFEPDIEIELTDIQSFDALQKRLDEMVEESGKNRFYMIRIDGLFHKMNVRSVYSQEKPYRRLVDVLSKEQTFFDHEDIEGAVVGLYCPMYMSYLNAAGWHMHFISKDKLSGGHVLGLSIKSAHLSWGGIDSFRLTLPKNDYFNQFDLSIDQSKDIERVEKNA